MLKIPSMLDLFIIFWLVIKSLWYVWVVALGVAIIPFVFNILARKIEEIRLRQWLEKHKRLEEWKKLDGGEFEKIVALIYKNLGYKTEVVGGAGDQGIDVIIQKDNKTEFIQCKQMGVVPPKHVREFYGSVVGRLKEGEKGFLVTTGDFTAEGKEFVKDKPIELVDGLKLEKLAR
jgi:restriction system protein